MTETAIVLLSGGLDSSTVLAIAQSEEFLCHALSFQYGQKHAVELTAAKRVAAVQRVESHTIVNIDNSVFGKISALTSDELSIPNYTDVSDLETDIPVTYVPARNTIFLSYALAFAEVLNASSIFIGVNALDYSGYPDCRPEYVKAYEAMANLATKSAVEGNRVKIRAPLVYMTKKEIIEVGLHLRVDYSLTHSCYEPNAEGVPCGVCASCLLRAKGFAEAGLPDPALIGARF